MGGTIFINYRRGEDAAVAGRLRQAFRSAHDRFRSDAERPTRVLEKALVDAEARRKAKEQQQRRRAEVGLFYSYSHRDEELRNEPGGHHLEAPASHHFARD
jgi:hypothetical protein